MTTRGLSAVVLACLLTAATHLALESEAFA